MADIITPIENGQLIKNTTNSTSNEPAGGSLGKDAFLQLLVCQMQNQDPLQPQDNTEYIQQLATFSSLESLQNIEGAINNSQALNLAGKYVDITTTSSDGKTSSVSGVVEYITMNEGKAYAVIDGSSYPAENITTVYDDEFLNKVMNENGN